MEAEGVAGPRDMLIDLRSDDRPTIICIGGALLAEAGVRDVPVPARLPPGSAASLLIAYHPCVAATLRPKVFKIERLGKDGGLLLYHGVLLPLSSDGGKADFVHGTIAWRAAASGSLAASIAHEASRALVAQNAVLPSGIWPSGDLGRERPAPRHLRASAV